MNDVSGQYAGISPFYDLLHADLIEDIPLVLSAAASAGGRVLELGCGSGRLTIPLAQAGYDVTGLDNSSEMLTLAQKKMGDAGKISGQINLSLADMRSFNLDQMFDLIIISANNFSHLMPAEMPASLLCIKKHLGAEGKVFLDLPNPFTFHNTIDVLDWRWERTLCLLATKQELTLFGRSRHDYEAKNVTIGWRFEDELGGKVEAEVIFSLNYLFPHEIEIMLENAGMSVLNIWGDYRQSRFNEDSQRLLVLASPT